MNTEQINVIEGLSASTQKAEIEGKLYAVKIFNACDAETADTLAKKLRERVGGDFEVFTQNQIVCAARPFITGTPFSIGENLAPVEALEIICEIAACVDGRVHGDLKPENIIRDENGALVATDFGARTFYRVVDENFGSGLEYLAPEQISGEPDTGSDIYALGILLGKMLCGKTPFDGKSEDSLINEKQRGSTDWGRLDADIPEVVRAVVEKASATDCNARYLTIAEFIEACKEANSALGNAPAASHTCDDENVDDGEDRHDPIPPSDKRFCFVGHTGAGKTVIAAGIYSTFSREKGLSVEAADEPTAQLANNFKTIIETGSWPPATIGAPQKLHFRIAHGRDSAELHFDEYMGERVKNPETFVRDILHEPDGVLLLMNPGSVQFQMKKDGTDTPQELALRRNESQSNLKSIIDYLFKLPKRPSIALVITASDRLKTDLRDFAPEFSRYVEEIEVALDARDKKWWRRFDISVCGELEDQTKPHLNPQGIAEPFLWLLNRHNLRERNSFLAKCAKITAGTLCAAALVSAAWWCVDTYRANAPERELRFCLAAALGKNKTEDLNALKEQLVAVRRKFCEAGNHIAENRGERIASCAEECTPFFLFPGRRRVFSENIREVEVAIDDAQANYIEQLLKDALEDATESKCRAVSDADASWSPLQPDIEARRSELADRIKNEIPPARERRLFADFTEESEAVAKNPSGGSGGLFASVSAFLKETSSLSKDERAKLENELTSKLHFAQKCVFDYDVKALLKKINFVDEKDLTKTTGVLEEWKAFDGAEYLGVGAEHVSEQKTILKDAVKKKTFAGLDLRLDELRKARMKSDAPLSNDAKKKYLGAVDEWLTKTKEHLPDELVRELSNHAKDAKAKQELGWKKYCETVTNKFISEMEGLDVLDMLNELKGWYLEHSGNPYVENAGAFVLGKVKGMFSEMCENWGNTEREYTRLKELCKAVRASPSETIKKSKFCNFAKAYIAWLENYSRDITVVDGKIKEQGVNKWNNYYYIVSMEVRVGSTKVSWDEKSPVLESGWYKYPKTQKTFTLEKPWDECVLILERMDDATTINTVQKPRSYSWSDPGMYPKGKHEIEWGDFILNVEVYGKTLDDIIAETLLPSK